MTINIISIMVTIIAGILTIIEFFKPNSNAKVQLHNKNGINHYTDNSTHINTTTNKTTNHNYSNTKDSNHDVENGLAILIGLVSLAFMLAFYSLTHKLIPLVCIILLTINIYRGTKVSFESKNAKIQWALKNTFLLIVITILIFTPKSILNIIPQIPVFQYESFYNVLSSITSNIKFIFGLYNDSILLAFNLIARILITVGILISLLISTLTKTSTHKALKTKDLIYLFIFGLLMFVGTNVEYYWDLAEPLRSRIENWFISIP